MHCNISHNSTLHLFKRQFVSTDRQTDIQIATAGGIVFPLYIVLKDDETSINQSIDRLIDCFFID